MRLAYIGGMNRRTACLAPLAFLAFALPAQAEKISLAAISKYLNALKTAEAEFTQVNGDGSISTGRIFIHRPNRVRFEYAPPDRNLVLASAGQVAVFDGKSRSGPQQYPLSKTPLSLILAPNVNLGQARMVTGYAEKKNTTVVTAQDPQHPEYGNIQMVFSANPTQLRQWVVTDDAGTRTTVILGDMKTGVSFPPSKFAIESELARRK